MGWVCKTGAGFLYLFYTKEWKEMVAVFSESGYTSHTHIHEKKGDGIMSYVVLTSENFHQEVLQSDRPVLVDFWASWCGPCQALAPTIDEIAAEQTAIKVGKVNVDEQPDLARQFRVMSIPTLMVFKNGEMVRREVGGRSKEEILAMVD